MSWEDNIKNRIQITTGDGQVWEPLTLLSTNTASFEFNVSEFEFPEIEGTKVDRRLRKGVRYPLELFFQGAECITEGHIKLIEEKTKEVTKDDDSDKDNDSDKTLLFSVVISDKTIEVFSEENLNKKQVIQALKEKEIEFDQTKNKTVLFENCSDMTLDNYINIVETNDLKYLVKSFTIFIFQPLVKNFIISSSS